MWTTWGSYQGGEEGDKKAKSNATTFSGIPDATQLFGTCLRSPMEQIVCGSDRYWKSKKGIFVHCNIAFLFQNSNLTATLVLITSFRFVAIS